MNKMIWLSLGCSLMLSGCTALMWGHDPIRGAEIKQHTVATDQILTFATVNHSPEGPESPLLLLGIKHTYVLLQGADELSQVLNSALNNNALGINQYQTLSFRLLSEHSFEGSIMLQYNEPTAGYTPQEQAQLKAFAFQYNGNSRYAYKTIHFSGDIQEASALAGRIQQSKRFRAPYSVSFYSETRKETFKAGRLVSKIMATPFTVAGDLVIIPLGATAMAVGSALSP